MIGWMILAQAVAAPVPAAPAGMAAMIADARIARSLEAARARVARVRGHDVATALVDRHTSAALDALARLRAAPPASRERGIAAGRLETLLAAADDAAAALEAELAAAGTSPDEQQVRLLGDDRREAGTIRALTRRARDEAGRVRGE